MTKKNIYPPSNMKDDSISHNTKSRGMCLLTISLVELLNKFKGKEYDEWPHKMSNKFDVKQKKGLYYAFHIDRRHATLVGFIVLKSQVYLLHRSDKYI